MNYDTKAVKWVYALLLVFFVGVLGLVLGFKGPEWYENYKYGKVQKLLSQHNFLRDDCKDFVKISDKEREYIKNDTALSQAYEKFTQECKYRSVASLGDDCVQVFSLSDAQVARKYYDGTPEVLEEKRRECIEKQFYPKFSLGKAFDPSKDFRTNVIVEGHNIFSHNSMFNSKKGEETIQKVKKALADTIIITPTVPINTEDVRVNGDKIELSLPLDPNTSYTIGLKKDGKDTPKTTSTITTPKKSYFALKNIAPVSLYHKNNLPELEVWNFDSGKKEAVVQLCPITKEQYAHSEAYEKVSRNYNFKGAKEFFQDPQATLGLQNCETRKIPLETKQKNKLHKHKVSLGENMQQGMYIAYLEGTSKAPVVFAFVNAHILMKVSKNGEGFFFVTDFEGKPLTNQKITVFANNYYEYLRKGYNDTTKNVLDPKNQKVYDGAVELGKTNEQGILKVDLQGKLDNYFSRTFGEVYDRDNWNKVGLYANFLVESSGETHKSYLASTWNAGVVPWNFGYTFNNYWWGKEKNDIVLNSYPEERKEYRGHMFPDRVLYLPNETVHLKGVVRTVKDIRVPDEKTEFSLKITDPKRKEVLSKTLKVNEFGSFSEQLQLEKDAKLGRYYINLSSKNGEYVAGSSFTVEVFKKPKFYSEVTSTSSLGESGVVKITEEKESEDAYYYYPRKEYIGKFDLDTNVSAKYYNGGIVKNAKFDYKIFKQRYWGNDFWDDCYYGCYWEPRKELYTSGTGVIDENGRASLSNTVEFTSSYDDYKYIVEVTVTDDAGETITSSNSVVVRLPEKYKQYYYDAQVRFVSKNRFQKTGTKAEILVQPNIGGWTKALNNNYMLVVKRKTYNNSVVTDVNGYKRKLSKIDEKIEEIVLVNDTKLAKQKDGNLKFTYPLAQNGEYVFEYYKINYAILADVVKKSKNRDQAVIQIYKDFLQSETTSIDYEAEKKQCVKWEKREWEGKCLQYKTEKTMSTLHRGNILGDKDYISVIAYDENQASNPQKNDNKLNVISEKVSYKVGETAKILVQLPVKNAKILFTVEKDGVETSEYIDVVGNVFFKEILVDDSFSPNAYISVFMVDTENKKYPEYKIGYTEVVIDKTDKKAFIDIKADKKVYKPREKVELDITVQDQNKRAVVSEVTVMVVDDALISLMGNIDPNILEKVFVKLPFSIQTAMSNIAMLRNYYFAREGLVGGSGLASFKGGDSAISTRSIFKNTAFYTANLVTDENGKVSTSFTLPDNLTNFRVMAISNAKDNHFGYEEQFIEVRKMVSLEDKTPLILRAGDKAQIGANLLNSTGKDMKFTINLETDDVAIAKKSQKIMVKNGETKFVTWDMSKIAKNKDKISYKMMAVGENNEGDAIEKTIEVKQAPILLRVILDNLNIAKKNTQTLTLNIPENTDFENSHVELSVSSNRLVGIEEIAKSLAIYPYGCVEQLTSSTLPNSLLKGLGEFFPGAFDEKELDKNIESGITRILDKQTENGGFGYWSANDEADVGITPYVVRSLIFMKNRGAVVDEESLQKAISFLEKRYDRASNDDKGEIYFALKMAGKEPKINFDYTKFNRHSLLSFTYGLVLSEKPSKELIEANIELLKTKMEAKEKENYYYWNQLGDKAIFTKMLLDYDYNKYSQLVDRYIDEMYTKDWSSYYYSTQTKNNVFMAFYKYLKIKKNIVNSTIYTTIGGKKETLKLDASSVIYKNVLKLSDIATQGEKSVQIQVENPNDHNIYADAKLVSYPEKIEEVQAYSKGIKIEEKIYEVLDETKLRECGDDDYWYNNRKEKVDCSKVLKKVEGNIYEKGKLYKSEIIVSYPEDGNKDNVTIEDYLPGTFRVINSRFKTESSSVRQAGKTWRWSHIESHPNVMMANDKYWHGESSHFDFYFRPEFVGIFVNPPATVYEMYNPEVRAYNQYKIIQVK